MKYSVIGTLLAKYTGVETRQLHKVKMIMAMTLWHAVNFKRIMERAE
jgi:hypothetical protein